MVMRFGKILQPYAARNALIYNETRRYQQRRVKMGLKLRKWLIIGADGGTRTLTGLPPQDFKSCVSTDSTTSALLDSLPN
jgi:hypothetical protein